MKDEQIKHMVNRFLSWKLPESFNPDGGIGFEPEFNVEYNAKRGLPPQHHEPRGTNLLDYTQAEAMVRHMIVGLPETPSPDVMEVWREAQRVHDGCVFADMDAPSELAASVIAEAKARWEREAFEKAAQAAEAIPTDWRDGTQPGPLSAYAHACREIAASIRALKEAS